MTKEKNGKNKNLIIYYPIPNKSGVFCFITYLLIYENYINRISV